jgi:hypothetical protein
VTESSEIVIGVDFAGPSKRSAQQRKILAVSARRICAKQYEISPEGLNDRLLARHPGWTAADLMEVILKTGGSVSALGCDFPFSIPASLLADTHFAGELARAHHSKLGNVLTYSSEAICDCPAQLTIQAFSAGKKLSIGKNGIPILFAVRNRLSSIDFRFCSTRRYWVMPF